MGAASQISRRLLLLAGALALMIVFGLSAAPQIAQAQSAPPGYCSDSQHDPTKWHPAVDPVTGCMYGHEHGANPNPPGSPFAPLVFGGEEATPNENYYKHNGYKVFYIHRGDPSGSSPTADPCDDLRVRIHMDVRPLERRGQYHSYEIAMAHCSGGQLDVTYLQGWMDFGTVVSQSVRVGDNGVRPNKFVPSLAEFQQYGLNIWEVWYGRGGLGVDMGWLMGEVPTADHHAGLDPNNPATWVWTGGSGNKRKLENFNFYGWRETRRGEFYTDVFGNSVDRNSDFCKSNACPRQYVSPLFGTSRNDQVIINLGYNTQYDDTGVNFPTTFVVDGGHLPWWNGQQPTQPPTTPPPTQPPTPAPTETPAPTGPAVIVDVVPPSAEPGQTVSVALKLANITGLYGLQAQCSANAGIVSGTARADGDVFTAANSFFVDSGYQANGSWMVAASLLAPNAAFSGSGTAFTLNYTVHAAGTSDLTCAVLAVDQNGSSLPIQVINGSLLVNEPQHPVPTATQEPTAEPTVPPTPDPVITPEPAQPSVIAGIAQYQNRPDSAGITAQLYAPDGSLVATATTGADGHYSFSDVALGAYVLHLSAPQHIAVSKTVAVEAGGSTVDAGTDTLMAGDTNDDGTIDIADATFVGANFSVAVPPAPANADLNADAVVDISDLVLVGGNYGLAAQP